jgi:hypothetical protein
MQHTSFYVLFGFKHYVLAVKLLSIKELG